MSEPKQLSLIPDPNFGAIFNENRKHRYVLWRIWNVQLPKLMFIGLNPSTANEFIGDNTIRKLNKITMYNGFGGYYMTNLFAIISSDPKILKTCTDPIGDNDFYLKQTSKQCEKIIFCWGNFKEANERSVEVMQMFNDAYCLIQNKNGTPKHPLYCKDQTKIIPFNKLLLI